MNEETFFKVQELCEDASKAILDQTEFEENGSWAGVEDSANMTLVDMFEMLASWKVEGTLVQNIAALAPDRHDLWTLLHNTAIHMGWHLPEGADDARTSDV